MSTNVVPNFPSLNAPLVDKDGRVSKAWMLLFQAITQQLQDAQNGTGVFQAVFDSANGDAILSVPPPYPQ